MLRKKSKLIVFSCLMIMLMMTLMAGCGKDNSAGEPNQQDQTTATATATPKPSAEPLKGYTGGPVELLIADVNAGIFNNPDYFESFFVKPLKAKYPEITLKVTNVTVDKLLAAGTPPDLVLVSNPSLNTLIDMELPEDLTPFIKQNNIDLSRIEPAVIKEINKLGKEKHFYGMPFTMNYGAMIYNIDIFEKFGVPLPKDNMNWDELLALAKRLTVTDGGVDYIGMIPPDLRSMFWQYNLPLVDEKTLKATLTTDNHSKVLALLKDFYTIPGYLQGEKYELSPDLFYKEQRVAMYPGWSGGINSAFRNANTYNSFKWDITTFPVFADRPDLGAQTDFHMVVVNKAGKNKEAAFQVLASIISDDVQMTINRTGKMSVLTDQKIRQVYAEDSEVYKGKKLQSIFQVKPAPVPPGTKFDAKINSMLRTEVAKNVVVKGMDINTALKLGEEKANKEIIIP